MKSDMFFVTPTARAAVGTLEDVRVLDWIHTSPGGKTLNRVTDGDLDPSQQFQEWLGKVAYDASLQPVLIRTVEDPLPAGNYRVFTIDSRIESLVESVREELSNAPEDDGHWDLGIDCDKKPSVPEGLKIAEHRKGGVYVNFSFKFDLFRPENEDGGLSPEELWGVLEEQSLLNANMLDFLLIHTEFIPKNWKYKSVYFYGTVYHNINGERCVRYIYWDDVAGELHEKFEVVESYLCYWPGDWAAVRA